jgi:transcriptional regulator with XRE-family HTH domain
MPKRADKPVADLMRQWREVAGLSRAEAGERLGLAPNAIRDIEQGLRRNGDVLSAWGLKKLIEDAK